MNDESVDIEVTEDAIWIRSGHSEFRLSSEDAAEFPDVAGFDDETYSIISAPALRELIRRTLFATDVESTRYALGGVLTEDRIYGQLIADVGEQGRILLPLRGRL